MGDEMKRVLISGAAGAMGKAVYAALENADGIIATAGIDLVGSLMDIPVFRSFSECDIDIDIVIDFSSPAALNDIAKFCKNHKKPVVLCTTGYNKEQEIIANELSRSVPVFRSANMSLGVNLIANLAKTASRILGKGFDIEIIEKHHRKKVDSPSGTAMMLANEINAANSDKYRYVYERESIRKSRDGDEIGIHSVRGGTIVGEHEIIFAGTDEVITISHNAMSKNVFATGAVSAAIFLLAQPAGFYDMNDLFKS